MTYTELHTAVENKEIVSAKTKEGKVYRLFHATNGLLCYFPPRRSRVGYKVSYELFETFVSFQGKKEPLSEEAKLKKQYNEIAKYKRLASTSTISNSWIEDCKNLPDFETWKNDKSTGRLNDAEPRPKTLFDLHITTGNKIDGKVISLSRIAKEYPRVIEQLRQGIKEKKATGNLIFGGRFAGYDMSISLEQKENGELFGYLSLEYKGCGNGYYYMLINDENFIGYDVD